MKAEGVLLVYTPNLQYLQRIHIGNLTAGVIEERFASDSQRSQLGAITQLEAAVRVEAVRRMCEALPAHGHLFQLGQSDNPHHSHVPEARVAYGDGSHVGQERKGQTLPLFAVEAIVGDGELLDVVVEHVVDCRYRHTLHGMPVIHPVSRVEHLSSSVIVRSSPPALPVAPSSLVLNALNVRIVLCSIASV